MTPALPSKQKMHRLNSANWITIGLSPDMGINKLSYPILAIDTGRLYQKIGLLKDPDSIQVEKVQNFLAEIPPQRTGRSPGSFASRNRRSSVKNDLTITYCGKTYGLGQKGVTAGGSTGLGEDKTVNLILRVLFALTLFDLGKTPGEKIHLSIAIPYDNSNFTSQEKKVRSQIGKRLSWGAADGMRSVEVLSLKVDPEDYHAEQFSRSISSGIPNFEGEWRETLGIGYQTFNIGIIDPDGYFDDTRSKSFEGCGTSLYYGWIATEIGLENADNPQFIEAVNSGADTFKPQGSDELYIVEARELAREWYLQKLLELVNETTPSEVERFIITGGGDFLFGQALCDLLWGKQIRCPEADIANVIAQLIDMAREI